MKFIVAVLAMASATSVLGSPADDYWSRITALCGQAFSGKVLAHPEGENDFAGQRLLMHVRDCTEERIRIPFVVGEDYSRTWVLTRRAAGIELKHDHRHEDGSPEAQTMYGGTTTNAGRPGAQYFPADEQTRQTIEAAFSNVWVMRIADETFQYGLWRLGTPRVFLFEFDLTRPVDPPAAPWGWRD